MHFNALKKLTLRSKVDLIWTSAILPFCNRYYLVKLQNKAEVRFMPIFSHGKEALFLLKSKNKK